MLTRIREKIRGYKTYITAAVGILGAIIAWGDGQIEVWGLLTAVWVAVQTCWVRAGIKKAAFPGRTGGQV